MTAQFHDDDPEIDALYADLAAADLQPLWKLEGLLPRTPRQAGAKLWKAEVLRSLAERSGQLIGLDRGGDRRVLALANPIFDGAPWATPTLWGAVQILLPGEIAPPHRHTPAALRFVLEGSGAWTAVNDDPVPMARGDVILTPAWTWHEHHLAADAGSPMLWFDAIDLPLVRALDAVFFEPGSDKDGHRISPDGSDSEARFALAPGLVPADAPPPSQPHSPLFAYRWADTDAALTCLLARNRSGHASIRYVDPTTGRDVMPTMRCETHRFAPTARTPTTRQTGSSIWVVFRGAGTTTVGDSTLAWSAGDCFVVPSWAPVSHDADEPSDLFVVSDAPVLEALHLLCSTTIADTAGTNRRPIAARH